MAQKKTLGESLVEEGKITPEQLKAAQAQEKNTGQRLGKVLVSMGLIPEEEIVNFISKNFDLPRIELNNYVINSKIIQLIPEDLARKYLLIPILKIGDRLTCAMVDPWNVFALDELRMKTNFIIEPAIATKDEIETALDEYYGTKGTIEEVVEIISSDALGLKEGEEMDLEKLEEIVKEPIVIKLVNLTIMKAIKDGASDIHIEPEKDELITRFRVDGMLYKVPSAPKYLQAGIISRLKILANLDIAERRVPQDGRFNIKTGNKEIDFRVSSIPTIYGENIVLRLLDSSSALVPLEDVGFSKENLAMFNKLIAKSHGIILVTGPTGSGKTTTLYASLDKINTIDKNIITVEDPVEYRLAGIRQIQINPKVNLTFSSGLRSILRQDPDIIMIGEIRDYETAEIAVQASLTGHLVFSTLHTNDAPGAITRLVDMGVEPFLISSSVIGILAQRLIRGICPKCKTKYTPTKDSLREIGITEDEDIDFCRGKGCAHCMNMGYKGRMAIFELMTMDDNIRHLTDARESSKEIKKAAQSGGMITLREDGIDKIKKGLSTIEEVLRITQD